MILAKREKIVLYLTIGVIVFGLIFNFVIGPILDKYQDLNQQIILYKGRLKRYLLLIAQKDLIQKKYSRIPESILSKDKGDIFVSALSEIENLAKAAGVNIVDVRPQAQGKVDSYRETLIDFRAEGAMEGYLKFIYDIENSLSLFRIKKLQFTSRPNNQFIEASFSVSQLVLD